MTAHAPAGPSEVEADKRENPARRRWIWAIVILLLLGVGFAIFRAFAKKDQGGAASAVSAEARVVPVTTAVVVQKDVPVYLEGLGNVVPLATVTVKSQVDGRLDKIAFREGQSVAKGDLLAQIDPRPFAIQLHQAEAALMRDNAQLANARLNLDRYRALVSRQLIAQQQVDDQQAMANQLEGTVKGDEAQAENARLQLDYARIRAPIDGITGVRLVDQGNVVHPSDATGIVVITQLDPIAAIFTLPQDDLARVAKRKAEGQLAVEAYDRDGSTRLAMGHLELIDNQVNQATASIRLKALFPNAESVLWPNEFLKLKLLLNVEKGALVIPSVAVQRGPQGTFVYVLAPGSVASLRPVEIAATVDQVALVSKGLAAGDEVVVEGQSQLRPGSKVLPRSVDKSPSAADSASRGQGRGAPPSTPSDAGAAR